MMMRVPMPMYMPRIYPRDSKSKRSRPSDAPAALDTQSSSARRPSSIPVAGA